MDILTHTLSGIAVGTVVAGFSSNGFRKRLRIISFAGFGAAIPDLDALSLWSNFDHTIGKLFGLQHNGEVIYTSKFWYSHHAFMHSIFAAVLIAFCMCILIYLVRGNPKGISFFRYFRHHRLYFISFLIGFAIHLFEDMPTPASAWGGVNFFWPMKSYIGGTGDIWWWNNYDLFLIVSGVVVLNILILLASKTIKVSSRILTSLVFMAGLTLLMIQIKTREFNFNYTGHTSRYQEYEQKSKTIQKHILGNTVYTHMLEFDNKMSIKF